MYSQSGLNNCHKPSKVVCSCSSGDFLIKSRLGLLMIDNL